MSASKMNQVPVFSFIGCASRCVIYIACQRMQVNSTAFGTMPVLYLYDIIYLYYLYIISILHLYYIYLYYIYLYYIYVISMFYLCFIYVLSSCITISYLLFFLYDLF